MKIILILFLFSCANIFPQFEKKYSQEVEDFMNIVEEYWRNFNYPPQPSEFHLTDKDIDNVMRKLYFAIADDPKGYENYIVRRYNEQAKEFKENKVSATKPTIGNIIGLIQFKIAEKYSKEFVSIITTPYFFRVKIKNKTSSIYIDREGRSHDQTIINGKIEYVVKGKKRFEKGENIIFMYLNSINCSRNFEIDKSYFIPLRVSTMKNSNYEGLTLQWFDCNTTYQIENEMIKIPGNYFKIAEKTSWKDFKEQFSIKYLIRN